MTFSDGDLGQLLECAQLLDDEGYHEKCRVVFDAADEIERLLAREKYLVGELNALAPFIPSGDK